MKKISLITIGWVVATLLVACVAGNQNRPGTEDAADQATTLTVFAAASLTDAFREIAQDFETQNAGVTVIFNFAGSQQLAQQLGQGAPADVFAAANQKQMDVAVAAGRVVSGTTQIFARNRLVVVTPKDNPAQLATLGDLAKPGVKIVFAAKEVPVGQYALDFLAKAQADGSFGADYEAAVLHNVVSYEENVRSVLAKVNLAEADAGIVYASDINADAAVQRIEIPNALNTLAAYPIAVIQDAPQRELAQKLVDQILSPAGQQRLAQHGFIKVK